MKIRHIFVLISLVLLLSACSDAYYQAQAAKAEATAAPYDSAARVAEAERDAQIAGLDTQRQIVAIQATAQSEQAGLLVTQTSKSLGILENAANRQVDLIESQYRTMQLNSLILIAAGTLGIIVCLLVIFLLARRGRQAEIQIQREIIYLPDPRMLPPSLIIPQDAGKEITQELPKLPEMRPSRRRRDW